LSIQKALNITWDSDTHVANLAKHGLDFASLDLDFFDYALIIPASAERYGAPSGNSIVAS
jgi:uncharacterized DUF497 family protein